MARLFRWLVRLTSALILTIVAAFALVYYFAARSLVDYDADYALAGISAPVEVVRDTSGVPHIFGETDADVFFALGFTHAQDRLWQMTMLRRTAQGRLSELFGERTLPVDILMRRLDLYGAARASVAAQDGPTTTALESYAAGVNAWLEQVNQGARGRGAPEMWLFNHGISRWTPADSIAVVKLMGVQLSSHLPAELRRAQASLALPPERVDDLLPDVGGAAIAALPDYAALVPLAPLAPSERFAAAEPRPRDPLSPFMGPELAGASNAWAAAPSRSGTGSTLLAGDPHLGLSAPSIWYLARLDLESGGVIGATIPGVPLVLMGRSEALGWGVTASYLDDQDILIEEVNSADASQYRTPEGWASFRSEERIVNVADGPAVTLSLQWSENGPVLSSEVYDFASIRPPGHVTVLAWPVLRGDDASMTAAMRLMRARNIGQAMRAMDGFVGPSLMLTLADRNRIAMQLIGEMPARDPAHESQGRLPTLGYKPENRWQGALPYSDNPRFVQPSGGILGHTNNKMIDRPFPRHVSFLWGDTQRVNRWRFLMQAREVHTRESFIEAQLDTVSYTARALLPLIGADSWFTGEAAPEGTPERMRQRALALLAEWNGEMNEHLPEPLIYAAWVRALQDRLIRDDLGPLAREFTHVEPLFIERVFRDIGGASVWCDVIQSAPTETCTDIARLALDDALVWIIERYGRNLESLRWGDAHEATHDHPVLGGTPILSWFVNIRQSTSGGDNTLLRGQTSGDPQNPFWNVHAAVYRGVYDLGDPDSSVFVISTGQSGHPLSRHYDDLGDLWRRGEYIPMSLDPALARAGAEGEMVLTPLPE